MLDEKWLTILKYAASVLAALYGLYATLTDFHEERHGKRVLSRWGYLGIALLILVSSVSIFSDYNKDKKQKADAENDAAYRLILLGKQQQSLDSIGKIEAQAETTEKSLEASSNILKRTAVDSLIALHETRRMNDPFTIFTPLVRLTIPVTHPLVHDYLGRVSDLHGGVDRWLSSIAVLDDLNDDSPSREGAEWPLSLLQSVRTMWISILNAQTSKQHFTSYTSCERFSNNPMQTRSIGMKVLYARPDTNLSFVCESREINRLEDDGAVRSHIDLPGKQLTVALAMPPMSDADWSLLLALPMEMTFSVTERDGRRWYVKNFRLRRCGTELCFSKLLGDSDVSPRSLQPE